MDSNMQQLASVLSQSLDPTQSKQAEQFLKSAETSPGFPLLLLHTVSSTELPLNVRLAGALFFKNLIRRSWTDEDGKHKFTPQDVTAIKSELLTVMIQVQPNLQVQLGEAISTIADSDFYKRWDTLVDELASKLDATNPVVTTGVLNVAHSIFKRWRPLFRSDELFLEILHVLGKFGEPYLALLNATDNLIEASKNDKSKLEALYKMLGLLIKIFYDLSCQELPPIFEDNLTRIMELFHKYLTAVNPLLVTDDDDESGPEEYVKAGICEILVLYAQKYEDAFGPLIRNYVEATWNLLTTIGLEPKYDILVSKALQFLTSVAKVGKHAETFNNDQVLEQVIEKIIVPNMTLRPSDEELFEDDPIEFIRRDLEGSDSDTRRRAANDFLRQLMEQFEKNVTEVTTRYINHFLGEYNKSPQTNWKSKDTALYLFTSIAVKGVVTQYGVSSTNMLVDVVDFFTINIASDLGKSFDQVHPILKVDAIKYLYTFRSQFTKEQLRQYIPFLATHLTSPDYVTYTYSAITTERILYLQSDKKPLFSKEEIAPAAGELLTQLFKLIEKGQTPEKISENEFLMRCVMRILIVCREDIITNAEFVLQHMIHITYQISKNPSNPRFNHYHFEALGALIRFVGPLNPKLLEAALIEPFMGILQNEVAEFTPYVFQLLGLLLESDPSGPLPEMYQSLIAPILSPALWESRGNVPALVRLILAISARGSKYILEKQQIEPILGIFQKLLSSKLTEASGFDLLEGIIINFPMVTLRKYMEQVFVILMRRLSGSKTETLTLRFIKLFYFLSSRTEAGAGPDFTIATIDSVQPGVFGELYKVFVLPDTQKLQKYLDRKTAVVGLTSLITKSKSFLSQPYHKYWAPSVTALLKLLEVPPVPTSGDGYDQTTEADLDDVSFSVSFATLNTAKKGVTDPFPAVDDARKWVGNELKTALAGEYGNMIQKSFGELGQEERAVLQSYV